ncbi:MAG: CCA tRNA nucleotidyltransferase [Alphaproteobacteria bacterium]|nr:CCA tRNA nucleotidyltransferase [Alphaproteobacteria bacterium]
MTDTPAMARKLRHAFLTEAPTRAVMAALGAGNARFVGGCVRNALLGRPVEDVDIATRLPPAEVTARLEAAGLRAVPTGIAHGTVTAIAEGRPFEVTTLRRDVATDGRHAEIAYGADFAEDAARRDFTINALYAEEDGTVHDPTGEGLADLAGRRVRFIGDPALRIREDYLRILRFFRFTAMLGLPEPDAAGLAACAAERAGLARLSGERVQKELLRLLAADDPAPALRAMAASGVLAELLPGRLDIARLARVVEIEAGELFECDPVRRLGALLAGDAAERAAIAARLRLPNATLHRLEAMLSEGPALKCYLSVREVRQRLYRIGADSFADRTILAWAADPKRSNGVQWRALLAMARSWERPVFPLKGADVIAAGVPRGPEVGRVLAEVEDWWIDSDFTEDAFSIIERMKAVVQASVF